MLPPSWKAEAQKAIEETANAERQKREAQANDAAAKIVAAINAISDTQEAQTISEDRNEKKDRAINIATLLLVLLTVVFTYLTWRTLSGQLDEMVAEQRPWIVIAEPVATAVQFNQLVGFVTSLKVRLENVGNSPAVDVHAGVRALYLPFNSTGSYDAEVERKEFCEKTKTDKNLIPFVVYPKLSTNRTLDANTPFEVMKKRLDNGDDLWVQTVATCVAYRMQINDIIRTVSSIFYVRSTESNSMQFKITGLNQQFNSFAVMPLEQYDFAD